MVRYSGTDQKLAELAQENALRLGAGHSFIVLVENAFPINLLPSIKAVPEVCRIFCATANSVEVIVAQTEQGRGILGVIDGFHTEGVETEEQIQERKEFLRKIGYKF